MARKQHQFQFEGFSKPADEFGGSLLKGNAKTRRPLATKLPIHLTLRAEKSVLRLPKTFGAVEAIVQMAARKYGVTIYKSANVGNHLHVVLKLSNRRLWGPFIRELTGRLAQAIVSLLNDLRIGRFWRFKPHTRIVGGWQKAFRSVLEYVELNQLEAAGMISRKETKSLRELRAMWADSA